MHTAADVAGLVYAMDGELLDAPFDDRATPIAVAEGLGLLLLAQLHALLHRLSGSPPGCSGP